MITEQMFFDATGRKPEDDDMERVNCPCMGKKGHMSCGWNTAWNLPRFQVGDSTPEESIRVRNKYL